MPKIRVYFFIFLDLWIGLFQSLIMSLQDGQQRYKKWMNLFQAECLQQWLSHVAGVILQTQVPIVVMGFVRLFGTKKISWGLFIYNLQMGIQNGFFAWTPDQLWSKEIVMRPFMFDWSLRQPQCMHARWFLDLNPRLIIFETKKMSWDQFIFDYIHPAETSNFKVFWGSIRS